VKKLAEVKKNIPKITSNKKSRNNYKWGVNRKGRKTYVGVEIDVNRSTRMKLAIINDTNTLNNSKAKRNYYYKYQSGNNYIVFYPKQKKFCDNNEEEECRNI